MGPAKDSDASPLPNGGRSSRSQGRRGAENPSDAPTPKSPRLGQANGPASPSKSKGMKELTALEANADVLESTGRPSRRAAAAAQAAIAQSIAFENQRGSMTPPHATRDQRDTLNLLEGVARDSRLALAAVQGQIAAARTTAAPPAAAAPAAQAPLHSQQPITTTRSGRHVRSARASLEEEEAPAPSRKRKAENEIPSSSPTGNRRGRPFLNAGTDAARHPATSAGIKHTTKTLPTSPNGLHQGGSTFLDLPSQPSASIMRTLPPSEKPTTPEEAGSDLPSLIAMAGTCSDVASIVDAIDDRLPAYKGNNIHAKLLRHAFISLRLGGFTNRKTAVPVMARKLYLLAGKGGPVAKAEAASSIFVDHLPAELKQFGLTEGASLMGSVAGDTCMDKYFGLPGGAGGGGGNTSAGGASGSGRPKLDLSVFDPKLVRLAEVGRQMLGLRRGDTVQLMTVMQTELLAKQKVQYIGLNGEVLSQGEVTPSGGAIKCGCSECRGLKEVTPQVFEAHATGGSVGRFTEGIVFQATQHSVLELLTLMQSDEVAAADVHMDHCYACKSGGELLCCDGCTAAWHLNCVDLSTVPSGAWLCSLCKAEGRKLRPPSASAGGGTRGRGRGRGGSVSGRGRGGGRTGGGGGRGGGGGGGTPGRVHMMAPSAQRRLGRPTRNLNRNKRLFEGGEFGLKDGTKVDYIARGEKVLSGTIVIDPAGLSGILCNCCQKVISCSQFESHAGHSQRRQPYEHIYTETGVNLKSIAAAIPDPEGEEEGVGLDDIADGCRDILSDLDTLAGGCVMCREPDFQRGPFGPRTILLCDQCEREYHVGCLESAGMAKLDALPEGDWFCSETCGRIHALMRRLVSQGQMPVIVGSQGAASSAAAPAGASATRAPTWGHPEQPAYTWQILNGKDGRLGTVPSIRAAADILQESFDPIIDLSTNTDLLPLMLYARQYGEWDYRGVFTLLLRYKNKAVVSAVVRVFGPQLAELPLIATRLSARRQGHARVLVNLFENLLREAGVHRLVLPAAHETVTTWKSGFAFEDMPSEDVRMAKQQLRILVFPGTEVLWKVMAGVPPPEGHHILQALPPEEDLREARAVVMDLVTAVAVAEGEEEPPVAAPAVPVPVQEKEDPVQAGVFSGEGYIAEAQKVVQHVAPAPMSGGSGNGSGGLASVVAPMVHHAQEIINPVAAAAVGGAPCISLIAAGGSVSPAVEIALAAAPVAVVAAAAPAVGGDPYADMIMQAMQAAATAQAAASPDANDRMDS